MSDPQTISRRAALASAGGGVLALPLVSGLPGGVFGAEEFTPLNRYPRMVQEQFIEWVRQAEARKLRRLEKLQTKADAEGYVRSVQTRIRSCFGPAPQRTPLKPQITGRLERDAYVIEKLIYESRPGFPVTANLYLPANREQPAPAVVGTCGHSDNGKAADAYQAFAQGLARQGYVCLLYDPIGQGERLQYVNADLTPAKRPGVTEHLHAGNQQFLVGEFLGAWRAWDGIRGLDYLLTRPEVDKRHLGVTGNSGGGTMTTWLCGVESRWTMAAPSCFVTTFRRNLENELPADTEQCPPRVIAMGLDHDDFLAAMAPKPVVILGKEKDFFDVRGTEEAYQRLKRLYRLLGAEENLELFVGPSYHGYSQENREAMYRCFNRATKVSDQAAEPEITLEREEDLWCTPRGQVAAEEGTQTVFDFTRRKSQQLAKERRRLDAPAIGAAIRRSLRIPELPQAVPDYRIWRYLGSRGYPSPQAIAYSVQSEPGIHAIVYRLLAERWYSRPPRGEGPAVLYVSHLSADGELREEPLLGELAAGPAPVFTCDVRGIGESLPDTCAPGSFHTAYGNDYFYASHSLMLDRPYLGQKVFDVLRVIQWMTGIGHTDIHLVGKGWGALAAAFAAVLAEPVTQVTLKHPLTSYAAVAESEEYQWPLSTLPPNLLATLDLPDVYRVLAAKQLRQIEPWGPLAGDK